MLKRSRVVFPAKVYYRFFYNRVLDIMDIIEETQEVIVTDDSDNYRLLLLAREKANQDSGTHKEYKIIIREAKTTTTRFF